MGEKKGVYSLIEKISYSDLERDFEKSIHRKSSMFTPEHFSESSQEISAASQELSNASQKVSNVSHQHLSARQEISNTSREISGDYLTHFSDL